MTTSLPKPRGLIGKRVLFAAATGHLSNPFWHLYGIEPKRTEAAVRGKDGDYLLGRLDVEPMLSFDPQDVGVTLAPRKIYKMVFEAVS